MITNKPVVAVVIESVLVGVLTVLLLTGCNKQVYHPTWPAVDRQTKPWTRWWWHGSAVTRAGITAELEAYQRAGIGGLEITPIYGVYGEESTFIDFLSPQWMEMLLFTLQEAGRLGLGIDMATGTGWPFGGPWIGDDDACKNMYHQVYTVAGGQRLTEKIRFIQPSYLRAIGNSFHGSATPASGTIHTVGFTDPPPDIRTLQQPIAANKNLQALAIDQVQFERPLALQTLMAYGPGNAVVNLTDQVEADGTLAWIAPPGTWTLYAIFPGWHGKMVERAGPGGEGNVIDHFSAEALQRYLQKFDSAFAGKDLKTLRAFFNDSYEVDDARGAADWTPALFAEFEKRRGYDLRNHLPALFGNDTPEKNARVLCDYRETISDLLLQHFTMPWRQWAHGYKKIIRNQAHGSPANILDLYAAIDIPEIEGIEPLRIRMASSAGNVSGKELVSSESATWLDEHFESNLHDIKVAIDRFFVNGVNHVFYHGTCYSPPDEPWPGRLFYAAVHMNPRNPQWDDARALNNYIARCQSWLQRTRPDQDVLLYLPIYDRFSTPGKEMVEHFDGIGKQFDSTAFATAATTLYDRGYAFDYISDRQLHDCAVGKQGIRTSGDSYYQVIVLPHSRYIPWKTFEKITMLVGEGAVVLAPGGLPEALAGNNVTPGQEKDFRTWKQIPMLTRDHNVQERKWGSGVVLEGNDLEALLEVAAVRRERLADTGLRYIRKRHLENDAIYFISGPPERGYAGWLALSAGAGNVIVYDPMRGTIGRGVSRVSRTGDQEVYLELQPGQSVIVQLHDGPIEADILPFYRPTNSTVPLQGPWTVTFIKGGPELPAPMTLNILGSWPDLGIPALQAFSGTAKYATSFPRPAKAAVAWSLDLGDVKESTVVTLNGRVLDTLLGPPYRVTIDAAWLKEQNELTITVSNLMANRIADLDKRGVFWKKFYNVNLAARKVENRTDGIFSAAGWAPRPSGLLGSVTLVALERVDPTP
ncbi:glycosyl hydrolase [Dawidia soli]|uniref:Glycoside hydrolase family 2 protein n=1 Tax=Dawidia soli TaxID=2782352 RepID=A0AAP2D6F7_9BACT|nr:glycosyl hydrolase [Dawidia soli]MBT1686248.1 glycoside hydrolase family 2 protein [Dawidia soli]